MKIEIDRRKTDVLIIGAGGAGARAAVEAARTGMQVVLVCRSPMGRGGLTPTANGGYHAAVVAGDSPEIHAGELIRAGCHLNDRALVRVLTEEALQEAKWLEGAGARVNWNVPSQAHDPEMQYPRSLFIPGKEILSALGRHIRNQSSIQLLEDCLAIRLLTRNKEAAGALLFNIREGKIVVLESKTTILATGSLGEVYPLTAQEPMGIPTGSTGSGYVLAGLAGADLVDMEMVQISPIPEVPRLIQGMRFLPWPHVKNREGKDFLSPGVSEYSHESALAVCREIREGRGPVLMDLRGKKPPGHSRHPIAAERNKRLEEFEATPYQRPIRIGAGALFMMGGVHINERCETSVPGLYAAGEVSGNVHGARRVSGNAFPEMVVFGARAGKFAGLEAQKKRVSPGVPEDQVKEGIEHLSGLFQRKAGDLRPREMRHKIRSVMGKHAHMFRNRPGLEEAIRELHDLEEELPFVRSEPVGGLRYNPGLPEAIDVSWLLHVGQMICQAALKREESRGFHFREDFSRESEEWLKHTVLRRVGAEWVSGSKPINGA